MFVLEGGGEWLNQITVFRAPDPMNRNSALNTVKEPKLVFILTSIYIYIYILKRNLEALNQTCSSTVQVVGFIHGLGFKVQAKKQTIPGFRGPGKKSTIRVPL